MNEIVQNSSNQGSGMPSMQPKAPLTPPMMPPKPPAPPSTNGNQELPNAHKKSGGSGIKIFLTLIFSAILSGGGAFVYQQFMIIEPLNLELSSVKGELGTTTMEKVEVEESIAMMQKEIDRLSCDGIFDEEQGCVEIMVKNEFGEMLVAAANDDAIGIPIEGYDAELLLGRFPNLLKEDFNQVEALQGVYTYDDTADELLFTKNNEPEHSAARTISDVGMDTLHSNLLGRYPEMSISELIGVISKDEPEDVMEIDPESDEDQDGLTYDMEIEYGTNPQIADTDGDGFNDGDEVTGGYNPLGEGLLDIKE